MGVSPSNFRGEQVRPARGRRILGWGSGLPRCTRKRVLCTMHGSYANKHGRRHTSATIRADSRQVATDRAMGCFTSLEDAMQVHQDLSQSDMLARIAELEGKLERARYRKLTLKVSAKGALSVYGMGRFPITLYRGQWEKLLSAAEDIKSFIQDNSSLLSEKE